MKLVLLPGMDGTGILFEPLVSLIRNFDLFILPLPDDGKQDFRSLSAYIEAQLPTEDFILVAESFSGGIAARLSQRNIPHLKGIIFVASFLSAPKKIFANFAAIMPIGYLVRLPFLNFVYRYLLMGKQAKREDIVLFKRALGMACHAALKLRLREIARSTYDGFKSSVPVVYLGAAQDRLVTRDKRREFSQAYSDVDFFELNGPHFVLQVNPKECASAIVAAVKLLIDKSSGKPDRAS